MGALAERKALDALTKSWRRVLAGAREAVRPKPPALPPGGEERPQEPQGTGRTPGG